MKIVKPNEKPPKRLPPKLRALALKMAEDSVNEDRAKEGLPPIVWGRHKVKKKQTP